MRAILVVLTLVVLAGFIYLNDYQSRMMAEMTDPPPASVDSPRSVAPDLESLGTLFASTDDVFVAVTPESQKAFLEAMRANPGAKVWELGVSLENSTRRVASPDGSGASVEAFVIYTDEALVPADSAFRTDAPLYVLEELGEHETIRHVILNPDSEGAGTVLGPAEIAALRERLQPTN